MSDLEGDVDLFKEPEGFYQPAASPTFATHTLLSGESLQLRLVGHNPLWGHLLWNAGRTISEYLEESAPTLVKDRAVLELGAGAGLPSIVCTLKGAAQVVVTDYPDVDLIENLNYNIVHTIQPGGFSNIVAEGYLWGNDTEKLVRHLPADRQTKGFDTVVLADLLFNHSEHEKLIQSVQRTLKHDKHACALVFFTPYRPWLLEKDLSFFDLARANGFEVAKILEKQMDQVLFVGDPGDESLRRTVFGYTLKWSALPMTAT
ncbi:hypothetical protein EJ08DRAFT_695192 [Tothia fuscella]|uniref:Protein N-terminal and lysine N-methyltransferase EFM7 n=1 Tax=Tothia fuscella TaxID=1048955 RepID=A0A9P4NWQ3_9PEZI|nr:hypothetical protein EJ08DRAFT_695192 [Tothia fuscella]